MLAQAQGLSKTFNTLYDQLDKQNSLINQQLGALTSQVNNLSQSVAEYNDAIAKAKSAGAVPNDLLDARDEAVRKLSEMVGVTAVTQDDNSVSLFIGSGQPLVVGNTVSTLSVVPGAGRPDPLPGAAHAWRLHAKRDPVGLRRADGRPAGVSRYRPG